ncbi:MAG: HEPN domain-containing protein, partial [Candidatus Woesearchaeota archaeon]
MLEHEKKLHWCLLKESRMKKIEPNAKLAQEHIQKAKHNLRAADYNIKGGFSDWGVSQCYYAMYHSLLSILFKVGYASKNHECTINAIEYLIYEHKIDLDLKDIAFIRTTEQMTAKDAKSLREEFQYGTQTAVNEILLSNLLEQAKHIVQKVEIALHAL